MEKRKLGQSSLSVSPLVLGGNVFGWTIDEAMSFKILDGFVDAGFNTIDTADVYSRWVPKNKGGESESIIGKWLKKSGKRDKVLIATKVGMDLGEGKVGLKAKHIVQAVEDSLRRLQIETIDLYQSHKDDPLTQVTETLEAFDKLLKEGKVRAIGASQFSPERLKESLDVSRKNGLASYVSLQPLYNLYDHENFDQHLAPLVKEYHLGVISYYSLASGFLSGKYRTEADVGKSPRGEKVRESYLNPKGMRILDALDKVSKSVNAPISSVALAWVLANPLVTAPIASATSLHQLAELTQGAQLRLNKEMIVVLNQAAS